MKRDKKLIVKVNSSAHLELLDQIEYYNNQLFGLGESYLNEIIEAVEMLRCYPSQWPMFTKNSYRYILKTFPYSIIYNFDDDYLNIYAYMHHKRGPKYVREIERGI